MSLAVGSPNSAMEWETDDERNTPAFPTLKSPMDTRTSRRYSRTPSRGSKNSRRSVTPPARMSRSPPPMPGSDKTDKSDRVLRDHATDEKISILDPRRFTPTLHANLVGEILSLKRDQEEKRRLIEGLESQLHSTREEEDGVHNTLQITAKENRSLKRQLALLEGGTSSALSELARERDEAVEVAADSKRRLEVTQKKLKAKEESAGKAQGSWVHDKNEWEEERRKTDRKIHVLESRLKTVLEEVEAYQLAMSSQPAMDDEVEDRGKDSDAASIRSMGTIGYGNRFSIAPKHNGYSLADELDFDDESDYGTETNGRDSVMSNNMHMRNDSRASTIAKTHRRHNSVESLIRPGSVTRGRFQHLHRDSKRSNGIIRETEEPLSPTHPKVVYIDTGIQYSPPPSPKLIASVPSAAELQGVSAMAAKWDKQQFEETSTEANSRRKRVSVAKSLPTQGPTPTPTPAPTPATTPRLMVSAAAQTAEPLSPPDTPRSPVQVQDTVLERRQTPAMTSAGTQTEKVALSALGTLDATLGIPSIAIHPPNTRPSSPKKSLLPQLQRDFACQVSMPAVPMVDSGVQTEEIRIDQRLDRLPAHLHPSAVTSRPTSPAEQKSAPAEVQFTPVAGNIPARNPKRLMSQSSTRSAASREIVELENRETTASPAASSRKPSAQMGKMFTAFHDMSSGDEMDDFGDADLSDSEFRTALSAPRCVRSPEVGRSPTTGSNPSSPETVVKGEPQAPASPLGNTNIYKAYKLSGNQGVAMPDRNSSMKSGLQSSVLSSSRSVADSMRKGALIQNGINAHHKDAADPPFAIPTRASSKQPNFSAGMRNGAEDRSPTRNEPFHKRGIRTGMYRANSIRKGRNAASGPNAKKKHGTQASRSSSPPLTPSVPPMPSNAYELVTPRNDRHHGKGHRHQYSATTATTEATTGVQSNTSSQAANGVVDAIAQTMVGEWMFKYVRRRKSFGLGGGDSGRDDSSNDRHKRWVWLAPYERAILWSSKQPSSGSALLGGKSGRKLTIQSVLDVKDDNPTPKGQLAVFNRSILILTPQRALKFTAVNADRHYLWLTALSFLAHSQQDVPDIPRAGAIISNPIQQPQQHLKPTRQLPDYPPSPPQHSRPRPRIRDSIRLAKTHNPVLASPPRGLGATMSSQNNHRNISDRIMPPMPSIPDVPLEYRPESQDHDSAEPPVVSRFGREPFQQQQFPAMVQPFHARKRSNTGGRVPPPLSFRGFGGNGGGHAPMDSQSTGMSDFHYGSAATNANGFPKSAGIAESATWSEIDDQRSEISRQSSTAGRQSNMFEAIGTMRMEAFISPLAFSRFEAEGGGMNYPEHQTGPSVAARKRNKNARRQKSRSRSRSRTRADGGGPVRGGVAGWREEYISTYGGGAGNGGGGSRLGRRDSRYGGTGRENGYRTAGEDEARRGRRGDPFEGF